MDSECEQIREEWGQGEVEEMVSRTVNRNIIFVIAHLQFDQLISILMMYIVCIEFHFLLLHTEGKFQSNDTNDNWIDKKFFIYRFPFWRFYCIPSLAHFASDLLVPLYFAVIFYLHLFICI